MLTIALIANYVIDNESIEPWGNYIGIPVLIFIIFGMLITFVDFITQGWLKKKKWISRVYFPIYWVFSYITLSFLYRPIVYNFLDNKFGKRISMALLPVYILILVGASFKNERSNYFNREISSNSIVGNSLNYEDMLTNEEDFIEDVAISSKVITEPYLKVFLVFDDNIEDNVFKFNPGLKPERDIRGFKTDIIFTTNISRKKRDSLRRSYIKTLNDIYTIKIDTTYYDAEFIVGESLKKQKGFETYIGIKDLSEGKHLLALMRKRIRKKDTQTLYVERIPFWYYPN